MEMMANLMRATQLRTNAVQYNIEARKLQIIAKKEENADQLTFEEADAKWDLEVFQFGANMLAAVSGGVSHPSPKGVSKTASAIGGAISGAAAGSAINVPYGTAVGAVVGLGAGLLA